MYLRRLVLVIGFAVILVLGGSPVQAFTFKDLNVALAPNGDATLTILYDLSIPEHVAVFLKIADPERELERAFERSLNKPVFVSRADSTSSVVNIPAFATVTEEGGVLIMSTPSLSFAKAEVIVNQYWFAPLVSPDFSPVVTMIVFPDGYREKFYNVISIPSVTRRVPVSFKSI